MSVEQDNINPNIPSSELFPLDTARRETLQGYYDDLEMYYETHKVQGEIEAEGMWELTERFERATEHEDQLMADLTLIVRSHILNKSFLNLADYVEAEGGSFIEAAQLFEYIVRHRNSTGYLSKRLEKKIRASGNLQITTLLDHPQPVWFKGNHDEWQSFLLDRLNFLTYGGEGDRTGTIEIDNSTMPGWLKDVRAGNHEEITRENITALIEEEGNDRETLSIEITTLRRNTEKQENIDFDAQHSIEQPNQEIEDYVRALAQEGLPELLLCINRFPDSFRKPNFKRGKGGKFEVEFTHPGIDDFVERDPLTTPLTAFWLQERLEKERVTFDEVRTIFGLLQSPEQLERYYRELFEVDKKKSRFFRFTLMPLFSDFDAESLEIINIQLQDARNGFHGVMTLAEAIHSIQHILLDENRLKGIERKNNRKPFDAFETATEIRNYAHKALLQARTNGLITALLAQLNQQEQQADVVVREEATTEEKAAFALSDWTVLYTNNHRRLDPRDWIKIEGMTPNEQIEMLAQFFGSRSIPNTIPVARIYSILEAIAETKEEDERRVGILSTRYSEVGWKKRRSSDMRILYQRDPTLKQLVFFLYHKTRMNYRL